MKKILLILLTLSTLSFYAQNGTTHWFFGAYCGLDFSSISPVAESGGRLFTEEGSSSISDVSGNLLFYTDGVSVWNANHQIMQNGTGLQGDDSSTQSAIIIPKPNDNNIYYIFTVDDGFVSPSYDGVRYSVVDMTLDGGLGGIAASQKNIRLIDNAAEKISAVYNAAGDAVWVVTLAPRTSSTTAPYVANGGNMNTFYAFRVSSTGVDHTAIVSSLALNITSGAGYMKLSPDGTKLAIANMNNKSAYLMDFDDVTGIVSNPVSLPLLSSANEPYGVEFSPDSSKLYISNKEDMLYQFDLNNNLTRTVIDSHQNYRSALQLGLDGKIYQPHTIAYGSGSNKLSVIANPNEVGTACNYNLFSVVLPGGMEVHQGLPSFIQSIFASPAGVEEQDTIELQIYPNPATDYFQIRMPENVEKAKMSIYNLNGQKVMEQNLTGVDPVIDVKQLSSGQYLVRLKSGKKLFASELIVK